MRQSLLFILLLTISFCSCTTKDADDFEFGMKFNSVRQKFGSPVIKHNMVTHNCCGNWTVYEIDKLPNDNKAYHVSKTIRAITNGKLTEEKDIYRKRIDDTTLIQLNILTHWIWSENKIEISSSIGKVDKRTLEIKAKDYLVNNNNYPAYHFLTLDKTQCDSALQTWGLSRLDKE
jgi:hypothetical protein